MGFFNVNLSIQKVFWLYHFNLFPVNANRPAGAPLGFDTYFRFVQLQGANLCLWLLNSRPQQMPLSAAHGAADSLCYCSFESQHAIRQPRGHAAKYLLYELVP